MLDGSQGDRCREGAGEVFGASGRYLDIAQSKGTDCFAEERYLLIVRLDEGNGRVGRPDLNW